MNKRIFSTELTFCNNYVSAASGMFSVHLTFEYNLFLNKYCKIKYVNLFVFRIKLLMFKSKD